MAKYRKKPVVIEAIEFTKHNFEEIRNFTDFQAHSFYIEITISDFNNGFGLCTCIIPTLEGDMIAKEGDFIIKGVKGEFYPCKPDIFKQTYELVE